MSAETTGRRATSFDVARAAGVSRSTVSQVLNGDLRFPAETRARVISAAEQLDYRASRAGRALVTGLSDIVVILVPNATFGPHLQDSVDRITNASTTAGLSVVVRFGRRDDEATLTSIQDLRPTAVVDLGVLTTTQRERLNSVGIRTLPSAVSPDPADVDADPVDELIGRLQVRELLRGGPRTIAYASLGDDRLDPFGPARKVGIDRELAERGRSEPAEIRVPLEIDAAQAAVAGLLERYGSPLGICCYNDDVAIAVIAALRRLGRSVPQDVSVIGVDRTDVGQLVSPRLSTIAVDLPALMESFVTELTTIRGVPGPTNDPQPPARPAVSELVQLVRGETS